MFKDYYKILEILPTASKLEIKQAYRKMSMKWHPDKNPGINVNSIMQDINEAYKILNDDTSRLRYNKEYQNITQQRKTHKNDSWNYDYEVRDEDLRNDINEARAYAKYLVEEFLKNLKETYKIAYKGAWNEAYPYIVISIIGIIATIIFTLIGAC